MNFKEFISLTNKNNLMQNIILFNNLSYNDKIKAVRYLSNTLEQNGEYEKLLEFSNEILNQVKKTELFDLKFVTIYSINKVYIRMGMYKNAELELNKAKNLLEKMREKAYNKDILVQYKGELYNGIGLLKRYIGKLDQAIENYSIALDCYFKNNDIRGVAVCYSNIGTVYQIKGDLNTALDYNFKALELFIKIDQPYLLSQGFYDIGKTYTLKGDLNLGYEYLLKSYDIRKKIGNDDITSKSLFEIILILTELYEFDKALVYFEEFKKLSLRNKSDFISKRFEIANAAILKVSNRIQDKAKSFFIFENALNYYNIEYEIRIYILKSICELLIEEMKFQINEKILSDLKDYIQELKQIAETKKMKHLLIETNMLMYKLSMIELNTKDARVYLNIAQNLAQKYNYQKKYIEISLELDDLENRIENFNQINHTQLKRINEMKIDETINNIILEKEKISESINEEYKTIFIIIINNHGTTLYAKSFEPSVKIKKTHIGGLLMASRFGISKVIPNANGNLEMIKFRKYTIIFQTRKNITFCIAYTGITSTAIQKLEQFIQALNYEEVSSLFNKKIIQPKLIAEHLDKLIHIFY